MLHVREGDCRIDCPKSNNIFPVHELHEKKGPRNVSACLRTSEAPASASAPPDGNAGSVGQARSRGAAAKPTLRAAGHSAGCRPGSLSWSGPANFVASLQIPGRAPCALTSPFGGVGPHIYYRADFLLATGNVFRVQFKNQHQTTYTSSTSRVLRRIGRRPTSTLLSDLNFWVGWIFPNAVGSQSECLGGGRSRRGSVNSKAERRRAHRA